jgi:hypothetical protein
MTGETDNRMDAAPWHIGNWMWVWNRVDNVLYRWNCNSYNFVHVHHGEHFLKTFLRLITFNIVTKLKPSAHTS